MMKKFKKNLIFIFVLLIIGAFTVYNIVNNEKNASNTRNTEARDDSLKMAKALDLQSKITNAVQAKMETEAVATKAGEDAADDPAIWINKNNPEKSLIIGTDKKAGLYSYNLKGEVVQFLNAGELNNVDLRDGFIHKNKEYVLIAASNRTLNTISLFLLNPESLNISLKVLDIKSEVNEVYGLCMYKEIPNFYVFVNGKDGNIEQFHIQATGTKLSAKLCRKLKVNSQPEGMVCNDLTGDFFIGVEEEGIYTASASPDASSELKMIPQSSAQSNNNISYDIEGLAIYQSSELSYLIASSQGNFSYAVYDIKDHDNIRYLTSFKITDGIYDGVEETDGLEVVSFPVNADYPKGMLVVQDGFNYKGDTLVSQNFKYISWKEIENFLHSK